MNHGRSVKSNSDISQNLTPTPGNTTSVANVWLDQYIEPERWVGC